MFTIVVTIVLCLVPNWSVRGLDNGVALTPPMGWMNWERFLCNTDCLNDPENCISESLIKEMADRLASDGYLSAGYQYLCLDDCWMAWSRDDSGQLQANNTRFPSGIKELADYIHQKGLKLGMYTDVGFKTCAQYPGSAGYYERDAQTLADWGVDMLKVDGCYANVTMFNEGFPAMGVALNKTGRPIVYSCEWPMYMRAHHSKPDQKLVAQTCNMFRQKTDIIDSWDSVIDMIDFFGNDSDHFSSVARPGAWNDPDQLVIGDFGLSYDQQRVQIAMYAVLASPLIMSVDLRSMTPQSKSLLLNKHVIAINQDPMGIQGKRILKVNRHISIWVRPISPRGSYAIAVLNTRQIGGPETVVIELRKLGLVSINGYDVREVFEDEPIGHYTRDSGIVCQVNPTGVVLYKATLSKSHAWEMNQYFNKIRGSKELSIFSKL